jgi:hypothetical protein
MATGGGGWEVIPLGIVHCVDKMEARRFAV